MAKVELHRNGINAHYSKHTYYALDSETRKQITKETESEDEMIAELIAMGYKHNEMVQCY